MKSARWKFAAAFMADVTVDVLKKSESLTEISGYFGTSHNIISKWK